MTTSPRGFRPTVTPEDVRVAQNVLDAVTEDEWEHHRTDQLQAALRGVIAVTVADVREAAHLQGAILGNNEGRQAVAHLIRDALHGEGL